MKQKYTNKGSDFKRKIMESAAKSGKMPPRTHIHAHLYMTKQRKTVDYSVFPYNREQLSNLSNNFRFLIMKHGFLTYAGH